LAGCARVARVPWHPEREPPRIRVALVEYAPEVELRLEGPALLRGAGAAEELPGGAELRARAAGEALVVDVAGAGERRGSGRVELEPRDGSAGTRFADNVYAGRVEILRSGDRLTLVNEVPLEDYLRGVVPWEIGAQGARRLAAVEAQAIVARTYAYKRLGQHADAGFDVYADVTDQVYLGTTRQDSLANRAIAGTRGSVLAADADLIDAYYSSTCGGHTSRIEAIWEKPARPYLRGRRDAPPDGGAFCSGSRHFRWTEAWSGAGLERTLQETLPPELGLPPDSALGGLVDLRVAERDESGRVRALEIQMTRGVYRVLGDRIRWVLRPRDRAILRSTLFKLDVERRDGFIVRVVVRGGGNGHGVGMCQTGALAMAERGFSGEAILAHYYPGARLVRAY
jgi:stage II sporulation protein D